ncbi:hypothetical protein Pmani_028006 [Petrolisthes manimaculis]|uniref:NTF2 domain-containing protein n=1 Tax=Petrolisthes manimaculis TaxID=1843537 RepID=A0AAE1P301_9EUCA|nr:hypothetical protein Pmani_028006 [Petrolisthes manimaculis]
MSSTVQLDITHLTLPPINLTADDVQAKFVTFKGSFQQEVKKIHNTPSGSSGGARPNVLWSFNSFAMSLAKSPQAAGIRQLLQKMEKEDVVALARTASNNRVVAENAKEAVDIILTFTPDLGRFFSYRRITSQALFEYLFRENVVVDCQSSKMQLIAAVQDFWEKNAQKETFTNHEERKCTGSSTSVQSNIAVAVCNNITINIGENHRTTGKENIGSSNEEVQEGKNNINSLFYSRNSSQTQPEKSSVRIVRSDDFSSEFCKWYYTMVNRLQPAFANHAGDTLQEEVFLSNSSAEVYLYGPSTIQKSAVGQRDIYTLLKDVFTEHKIIFNPNMGSGIQSYAVKHGLIKVMVCGTLHQENSFVGIFEQEFGLVMSPVDRAWKIMYTKLNLKQTSQPTPSLPKSQVFEITM